MDWEVQDYRKKPPPPSWFQWTPSKPGRYIVAVSYTHLTLPTTPYV